MNLKYFYFLFLIVLILNGCRYEEINTLAGIWVEEEHFVDNQRISRLQYDFRTDNTIEILRIELSDKSRAVLGYRSRAFGDYSFDGSKLILFNLTQYSHDDSKGLYSTLDELVPVFENHVYEATVIFDESGRQLTLVYPPCGPNSLCLSSQTFQRDNFLR